MKLMQKQQGFTLVELIIVIVILGILAITAAPKFLNLAGDARGGTLQAVLGSVTTANSLVNAKVKIQGKSELDAKRADRFVYEDGAKIFLQYGYPVTSAVTAATANSFGGTHPAYDGLDSTALKLQWAGLLDVSANDFTTVEHLVNINTGLLVTGTTETAAEKLAIVIHPKDIALPTTLPSVDSNSCYVFVTQAYLDGSTIKTPVAKAVTTGCSQ